MHPLVHFASSLLLFLALYPFFGPLALLVFLGGFLVDLDYYLIYICMGRGLNPVACYKYFKPAKKEFSGMLFPLHSIEVFLISIAAAVFFPQLLFFLLGLSLHYFLDLYYEIFMIRVTKSYSIAGWLLSGRKWR